MSAVLWLIEIVITAVYWGRNALPPVDRRRNSRCRNVVFTVVALLWLLAMVADGLIFPEIQGSILISILFSSLIIFVFYRVSFFQNMVQSAMCWIDISLVWTFCQYLCGMFEEHSLDRADYTANYGLLLYNILLFGVLILVLVLRAYRFDKNQTKATSERNFWSSFALLMLEWVLAIVFALYVSPVHWIPFCFSLAWLTVVLVSGMIRVSVRAHWQKKLQESVLQKENQMLYQQYSDIKRSYEKNKQLIHDFKNHNILLRQYLENGQTREALDYIKALDEGLAHAGKKFYCGISVIDFMLEYKIGEAKAQNIQFNTELAVYACPLKDMEMCVVLGNLLDNAIEAVSILEPEQRQIDVYMKTANEMFMLEIGNPYKERLRKVNGRYLTTKPDREYHGYGIAGVNSIMEAYHGQMLLDDSNGYFKAQIIIDGGTGYA